MRLAYGEVGGDKKLICEQPNAALKYFVITASLKALHYDIVLIDWEKRKQVNIAGMAG